MHLFPTGSGNKKKTQTMPPNQRATDKQQFGITLKKDELAKIDKSAKRLGLTRTEFMRRASLNLVDAVQNNKINPNNDDK